jgi:hypothetical protein
MPHPMEPQRLAIARGYSRDPHLVSVAYGLRRAKSPPVPPDADAATRAAARRDRLIADLWAWSQILRPTACFTHLSSAIARGWWLPYALPDELPVWIAQISSQGPTRRRGARVIRTRAIPDSERIAGLPLAVPAETLVSCAIDLALLDLLILVDAALHLGDVTLDQLAAVAAQQRRGAPRLRQAIALADERSESAMETVLRVLHVVSGIAVEPQHEFWNGSRFVARSDLWLVGTTDIHEYDGDEHLKVLRQRDDLRRGRRLADAGITRRGFTAADIADQPQQIIREACAATGQPFGMDMLEPWWDLWNDSTFSPLGRLRLRERVTGPRARTGIVRRRRWLGSLGSLGETEEESP